MCCRSVLLVLLALFSVSPVHAWSRLGHRLIGELAEPHLSPATRAQVRELLQDEPDPSLAGVANWADQMRDEVRVGWEWTAPLHYVRIRDRRCRYVATRDCRDGACLVGAVQRYAQRLADTSLPRAERTQALKFVVHFVGDVHQPLHNSYRGDKGGNEFQISLPVPGQAPQATNLHAIWDRFLLAESEATLDRNLPLPIARAPFRPEDAARWGEDSCALINTEGFYPRRPGKLPSDYFARMRPIAEARLRLAAAHLVQVLETVLARRDSSSATEQGDL